MIMFRFPMNAIHLDIKIINFSKDGSIRVAIMDSWGCRRRRRDYDYGQIHNLYNALRDSI